VTSEDDPKDPFRLGDDPGWRFADRRADALVALRYVFAALAVGLVVVGGIVAWLAQSRDPRDPAVTAVAAVAGVVVVGLLSLVYVRFVPVRLDCRDELALARSWRARSFARWSASGTPALAGLAAFALHGTPALYSLGLAFSAVGAAVSGPFHANLVGDQEALARRECAIALVPALRRPVDPGR